MKLTDTQKQILAAAVEHPDRLVTRRPKLAPAPREAIRKSLLSKGLIEPAALDALDEAAGWPVDGGRVNYRITDAGRSAVVEASLAAQADMPTGVILAAAEAAAALAAADWPGNSQGAQAALTGPAESMPVSTPRRSLRDAAQVVVTAWDAAPDRPSLDDAVAALRRAIAGMPARLPRGPSAPREPRQGTKQEAVLARLRRPESATIAQIVGVTGWQQHTVRGFFASFKKRQGIAVEVLERVRQVGPNKAGAKGSYSILYGCPLRDKSDSAV